MKPRAAKHELGERFFGYSHLTNELTDAKLPDEFDVYCLALFVAFNRCAHNKQDRVCKVSSARLAAMARISERKVERLLPKFYAWKLVTKLQRGGGADGRGTPNTYQVIERLSDGDFDGKRAARVTPLDAYRSRTPRRPRSAAFGSVRPQPREAWTEAESGEVEL